MTRGIPTEDEHTKDSIGRHVMSIMESFPTISGEQASPTPLIYNAVVACARRLNPHRLVPYRRKTRLDVDNASAQTLVASQIRGLLSGMQRQSVLYDGLGTINRTEQDALALQAGDGITPFSILSTTGVLFGMHIEPDRSVRQSFTAAGLSISGPTVRMGLSSVYMLIAWLEDPVNWVENAIFGIRKPVDYVDDGGAALLEGVIIRLVARVQASLDEFPADAIPAPQTPEELRFLVVIALYAFADTSKINLLATLTSTDGSPTQAVPTLLEAVQRRVAIMGSPDTERRVRDATNQYHALPQRYNGPQPRYTAAAPPEQTFGSLLWEFLTQQKTWTEPHDASAPTNDSAMDAFVLGFIVPTWKVICFYESIERDPTNAQQYTSTYDSAVIHGLATMSDEALTAMVAGSYIVNTEDDETPIGESVRFMRGVQTTLAALWSSPDDTDTRALLAKAMLQRALMDATNASLTSLLMATE